jgi:hypothetical protein
LEKKHWNSIGFFQQIVSLKLSIFQQAKILSILVKKKLIKI